MIAFKRHTFTFLLVALFVLLAVASDDTKDPKHDQKVRTAPTVANVTATQLFSEYRENEVAADEKYKGKSVVVTGEVESIGKDITDTMYVTLKTKSSVFGIQAFFSDAHKSTVASMKKGQRLSVKCQCDGKMMNVLLKHCSVR